MKINLTFDIIPMAIQSVRATRSGHFYQPQKNIDYKTAIAYQANAQLPRKFEIFKNAVVINKLIYVFPILKSMSKEMKNHIKEGYPVFKETKPDLLDNLFKGFADALNGIVWQDDALISYCKEIYKIYGEHPGIQLEVEDLWYAESY